jgi:hypothetical protein
MTAAQFNARYPVGTLVRYYPLVNSRAFTPTATRTEAWDLSDGRAVVALVGFNGGKSIEHVVVDRD